MITVRQTAIYASWLRTLRDTPAKARILARVRRLIDGNPGDVKPVGAGISELRINYGPGYRVYYTLRGKELLLLLCGGDKRTQGADITEAKRLAATWKDQLP